MNSYSFKTQITVMDMYRFQLRHAYCCISGLISVLLSIVCLILLAINHENYTASTNIFLILGGALFIIITPFNLLWKSYKLIGLTPAFKEPLNYIVDDNGVHVSQNDETADLPWEGVIKVIETKTQIVIYNTPKNGFIIPKIQVEDNLEGIKQLIKDKVSDYCVVRMK